MLVKLSDNRIRKRRSVRPRSSVTPRNAGHEVATLKTMAVRSSDDRLNPLIPNM
jgi:hypothetical protein